MIKHEKPWLCQKAITVLESLLNPSMTVLELGSGGSTIWFARRVASVCTIENNPEWWEEVQSTLHKYSLTNVGAWLSDRDAINDIDQQVAHITWMSLTFDLVFVDNNSRDYAPTALRERTAKAAIAKLKPNGWLVLDNIDYSYVKPIVEYVSPGPRIEVHDGIWHTGFYYNGEEEPAWYT